MSTLEEIGLVNGEVKDGNLQGEHKLLPIDKLVPTNWNTNVMDAESFDELCVELRTNGMLEALQVVELDDGRYRIMGGEHRWRAAQTLGWENIACTVVPVGKWNNEDLQKLQSVRFNVIRGKQNPQRFMKLYTEMSAKYGAEKLQGLMGFTDEDAFKKLIGDVKKSAKKAMPPGMAKKFDQYVDEVETIDDLSAVLNRLMADHGSSLEFNFIVFSQAGKDHLYIKASKEVFAEAGKLAEHAQRMQIDVNDLFRQVLEQTNKEFDEAKADLEG